MRLTTYECIDWSKVIASRQRKAKITDIAARQRLTILDHSGIADHGTCCKAKVAWLVVCAPLRRASIFFYGFCHYSVQGPNNRRQTHYCHSLHSSGENGFSVLKSGQDEWIYALKSIMVCFDQHLIDAVWCCVTNSRLWQTALPDRASGLQDKASGVTYSTSQPRWHYLQSLNQSNLKVLVWIRSRDGPS